MVLLDTNAMLWFWFGDARLGRNARRVIERAWQQGEAAVSAISFWEFSMLREKGRIAVLYDVSSWRRTLLDEGLGEIAVDGEIGIRANELENFHGDPADRLIVATALEGHQLVTSDRRILDWPGHLSRLDATQ